MNRLSILILVALGIGLVLVGMGLVWRSRRQARMDRERARASGEVVGHACKTGGGRGRPMCWPVIRFRAEEREVEAKWTSLTPVDKWPVGTQVEVLYDPDHPEDFHLEEEESEHLPALLRTGLIWLACALLAMLAMYVLPRQYAMRLESMLHRVELPRISIIEGESDRQSGGYSYRLNEDGSAVVIGYSGDASDVTLPLIIDGHIVTGIGTAFTSNRTLRRLVVPGTVAEISSGAFSGCIGLAEVELGEGVRGIGMHAFDFCPSLGSVTLPASLERIAQDAFSEDCGAVFRVKEGSFAADFCASKGYETETLAAKP